MRTSAVCSMHRKNLPVQMARLGQLHRCVDRRTHQGNAVDLARHYNLRSRLTLLTVLSTWPLLERTAGMW